MPFERLRLFYLMEGLLKFVQRNIMGISHQVSFIHEYQSQNKGIKIVRAVDESDQPFPH
jgi:uncharacterized protein Usg